MKANEVEKKEELQRFYAFHSKIYDLTRWSFLFGRNELLQSLPFSKDDSFHLLEVGCGTGQNLKKLAKMYPRAQLIGIDPSAEMLEKGVKTLTPFSDRVDLFHQAYAKLNRPTFERKFDVILFSYCLSMIHPNVVDFLHQAQMDLHLQGIVAAIDFHDSPFPLFHRHMRTNYVRMGKSLSEDLENEFTPNKAQVRRAYFGIWEYFLFLGTNTKRTPADKA